MVKRFESVLLALHSKRPVGRPLSGNNRRQKVDCDARVTRVVDNPTL